MVLAANAGGCGLHLQPASNKGAAEQAWVLEGETARSKKQVLGSPMSYLQHHGTVVVVAGRSPNTAHVGRWTVQCHE